MVSVFDFGSSSPGSSPGRGNVFFSGKDSLLSLCGIAPLSTQLHEWVLENLMLGGG